ncbi:MAG TPA: hypothetical protein VJ798_07965 [Rhizomicrobium sp.]|nr:hypothetical protein [Rhizomicrobium sp.]
MPASSGYSGTPLAKKLGIGPDFQVALIAAPDHYAALVSPLPDGVAFSSRPTQKTDLVHVFSTRRSDLAKTLTGLRAKIKATAIVWVSWPKKASKVPTDITEDTIRELCLPLGFVDVKVCAIDEIWSGLKLVIRKELR